MSNTESSPKRCDESCGDGQLIGGRWYITDDCKYINQYNMCYKILLYFFQNNNIIVGCVNVFKM